MRWAGLLIACGVLALATAESGAAGPRGCCRLAEGACRTVCEKVWSEASGGGADHEDAVHSVYKFCSPDSEELWSCLNTTIRETLSPGEWWGRACCAVPRVAACRRACAAARDDSQLSLAACRRSDELAFYDCLRRQRAAYHCCGQTLSLACHAACREAVWGGPGTPARAHLAAACPHSPALVACARNLTRSATTSQPHKYLPCCAEAPSASCRAGCERALATHSAAHQILAALEAADCGPLLLHKQPWQCFLRADPRAPLAPAAPDTAPAASDTAPVDKLGLDSAKLHCCHKAASERCARLCRATYGHAWLESWLQLETECVRAPAERRLAACLADVEEPCVPGCTGLAYCAGATAPLHRACSAAADLAAHRAAQRPPPACPARLLRAAACALHLRPCRASHASRLCAADCARVAAACLPAANASADVCADIAEPPGVDDCISLDDYLVDTDDAAAAAAAPAAPCAGAPCGPHEVCAPDGDSYACAPACPVGEASALLVAAGSLARVPLEAGGAGGAGGNASCVKVCECARGGLARCRPLPCVALAACPLGAAPPAPHGARFYLDCNACRCYAGERVCARRACGAGGALTGLPCNCPAHYLPVCAGGATYPSPCLARCAGHAASSPGPCAPCAGVVCPPGHACEPRAACLSPLQAPCARHACVPVTPCGGAAGAGCGGNATCGQRDEVVCGVDGVTYATACAASRARVGVDYAGACRAVGAITPASDVRPRCALEGVACAPLPRCTAFLPPGACCPRCGGGLRLLYSTKQVDRALYAGGGGGAREAWREWLSARGVALALQQVVGVAGCRVRAHLTLERELWAALEGGEACVREAERLALLVNTDSARLATSLPLSCLVLALPAHAPARAPARAPAPVALLALLAHALYAQYY